ncbi:MAG: isoprenylcysteine carboxylmethyltransferase family protein [Gemmataceae bacterium]|nr:isoprenylcysteine carboxylmethyltransferase family protein [Gemmataceae bacterium]
MRKLTILLKSLFMAACAVALFGTITWQLRRIDPLVPVTLPPWVSVGGVVLMAAGAGLGFATFGLFAAGRSLSPHAYFPDPDVLITWGPYKCVRNPMAKALFTVLCGWGFFLLSPTTLLLALVLALFLHLLVVFVEEPKLERRFGEGFRQYKRRVNRWVPGRRSLVE